MSYVLSDRPPLTIPLELAEKLGLNEAIVIQQIHFWCCINKEQKRNFRDGYYWTFNSYKDWQKQFPFWSIPTIKRTIGNLEKKSLVIVGRFNKLKIDRTKWYRINYEKLATKEGIYTISALQREIDRNKEEHPEELLVASFRCAGAENEATEEIRQEIRNEIKKSKLLNLNPC